MLKPIKPKLMEILSRRDVKMHDFIIRTTSLSFETGVLVVPTGRCPFKILNNIIFHRNKLVNVVVNYANNERS